MQTLSVFFPFDLFGSGGAGAGAQLLADAVREMLADNRREQMPSRARSYTSQVRIRELPIETERDVEQWRKNARRLIRSTLQKPERLIWVTGNHLGALPLYDELAGAGSETVVIQLDAHLDVYNLTDCETSLSHGNFLMHCAGELPRIVHLGSRDLFLPDNHVKRYYREVYPAELIASNPELVLQGVQAACKDADRLILDLDCDAFDPAFFPAVSQPLPFGLAPGFLLKLLATVGTDRLKTVAISEFVPAYDERDRALGTLLWLIEWLLLRWYEATPGCV